MNNKLIENLVSYFKDHKSVATVYLFGSQARKNIRAESDIDLAVLFTEKATENFNNILTFTAELNDLLKKKVDICDIESVDLLFTYRVLSEGKLVYKFDEEKRVAFETKLLRNYFDLKPFFDEYYITISKLAGEGKINARPFTY